MYFTIQKNLVFQLFICSLCILPYNHLLFQLFTCSLCILSYHHLVFQLFTCSLFNIPYNYLVFQLFICSLSFATFAVSISKPQNRLQLSFTLVLTTIAFKFVASQSLPKISYLTYLVRSLTIISTYMHQTESPQDLLPHIPW